MANVISKSLSLIVASCYLFAAVASRELEAIAFVAIYLLLPLACIWFGEEMGSFTGVMRGSLVTSESPGCLVAAGGWLLLILPIIVLCIWHFQGDAG